MQQRYLFPFLLFLVQEPHILRATLMTEVRKQFLYHSLLMTSKYNLVVQLIFARGILSF